MRWWLLILMIPSIALADEWSVGVGYVWRRFGPHDQLGATSPIHSLQLHDGHGPAVQALWTTEWDWLDLSAQIELAYLLLTGQPDQPYALKDRTVRTRDLVAPYGSIGLGPSIRLGRWRLGLAGGATVQAVSDGSGPFDRDVVPSASAFLSGRIGWADVRAAWNVWWTPTTQAARDFEMSNGLSLSIGAITPGPTPVRVLRSDDVPASLPEATTPDRPLDRQTDMAADGVARVLLANKKMSVEVRIRTNADPRALEAADRFRRQLLAKGVTEDRITMKVLDDGKQDSHQLIRFVFVVNNSQ